MKRSTDRILTTHVGSLIRPPALVEFLRAKRERQPVDETAFARCLAEAVVEVVRKQAEIGLDVISDGEFGKAISWSQYAMNRLSGFAWRPPKPGAAAILRGADRDRFAEFYSEMEARDGLVGALPGAAVVGPIAYRGNGELKRDIENFKSALRGLQVSEAFLPVAAPASVIPDRLDEFYPSYEDCQRAIGEAMRVEYRAIVDAGFLVQLDDARAAVTFDKMVPPKSFADYRKWLAGQVEVLNHAIRGIPEDRIRYHVCWGSWPGPHTTDVPIRDIVDLMLKVRAGAYVIEMANPRHAHEWRVWEDVKLPDGKILIPGVISHATNVVEHPELVAERIVRLAKLVGRENVIAGTDCGFAQAPHLRRVHPEIMWAKLAALVDGARLASKELWR
jgi:5-methyltetrahydropteroyltriglutamate--homocysteine methyltransferase